MDSFLNFIVNHYIIFLMLSILLIFALIGYFVDAKRIKRPDEMKRSDDIMIENVQVKENVVLSDALNKNRVVGVNSEATQMQQDQSVTQVPVENLDNNQNIVQ